MPKNLTVDSDLNELSDLKVQIKDNFKTISESIAEIVLSIKQIEKKIGNLEARQTVLENNISEEDDTRNRDTVNSDLSTLKTELEILKRQSSNAKTNTTYEQSGNKPVMPGSGFANITADYLKNLNKK
jgi:predicted  nucleic acid-binding Zn-ribbon protein